MHMSPGDLEGKSLAAGLADGRARYAYCSCQLFGEPFKSKEAEPLKTIRASRTKSSAFGDTVEVKKAMHRGPIIIAPLTFHFENE